MERKLDIIIPHYKEPWELCKYLLDSIALQRGVPMKDVRVVIVNDGDECLLEEEPLNEYPFGIVYEIKPHGGISDTRNYGIDFSDADYIMFCDADDGFLNNYALHLIFAAIQEGFDYLIGNFIEETFDVGGNPTIVKHGNDLTFMHGKVYRRQFLLDHNLRFDPAMTIHEDGYFNMLAYVTAVHEGKVKNIDTPIYIWRWNNDSVVRKDKKDFVLRTYSHVMQTRDGISSELKRRGYEKEYVTSVMMTVLNSYYDFQKPSYNTPENAKYLKAAEKQFRAYYMKYKKTFDDCTYAQVAEMARSARETAVANGMLMERTDLRTFLRHIEYEVKP